LKKRQGLWVSKIPGDIPKRSSLNLSSAKKAVLIASALPLVTAARWLAAGETTV
jgi:hypothetical protein